MRLACPLTLRGMKLILDTNVVMDWLVFEDASMQRLRDALHQRRATVLTHAGATEELKRVLGYRALKLDAARQEAVFERYQAQTSIAAPVAERMQLPEGFPRCRDPDDDPFIALAWHAQADALVSKDKAVLKVARRCRKFGVTILSVRQMNEALERAPP